MERNFKQLRMACKEQFYVSFTIKNYSRLPVFTCYFMDEAAYFLAHGDKNSGLIDLRPYESKVISYKLTALNRGRYTIGPVRIRTCDPLGLFTLDFKVHADMEVIVRPERLKLSVIPQPGFPQGHLKIKNPVYEDITLRRSVREYENGDEQKRINWRLSAKFGTLFTNQYESSYDAPFFIFLNLAEDDYAQYSRSYYIEKAIQIAACIVERCRSLKQSCGFSCYGENYPFIKPAQNQYDAVLDSLSLIKSVPGKLPYNPEEMYKNKLPSGALFFVVGSEQVESFFSKVEANISDINTNNTGSLKNIRNYKTGSLKI